MWRACYDIRSSFKHFVFLDVLCSSDERRCKLSLALALTVIIIGQGVAAFIDKPIQERFGMSRLLWGTILGPWIVFSFFVFYRAFFPSLFVIKDAAAIPWILALVALVHLHGILYFELVEKEPVSFVVPATSIHPLITVLLGVAILREPLGFSRIFVVACAVFAVYLLYQGRDKAVRASGAVLRSVFFLILISGVIGFLDKIAVEGAGIGGRFLWGFILGNATSPLSIFVYHRILKRRGSPALIPFVWDGGMVFFGKTLFWIIAAPALPFLRIYKPALLPPLKWSTAGIALMLAKILIFQVVLFCLWQLLDAHYVSVVAPISSMYPAVTVLLGFFVLKEKMTAKKIFAIFLAMATVIIFSRIQ